VIDDPSTDLPGTSSAPAASPPLDGPRKTLFEALHQRDSVSAVIYVGAIRVWADVANPDRLALAAHGMREMMDRMSNFLDVPHRGQARMSDKVSELHQTWKKARSKLEAKQPLPDSVLKKFVGFFDWYETDRPKRRERTGVLIRKMDPAGRPLPSPIEDLRVDEWMLCHNFFTDCAHHRQYSDEEFETWLDTLERFLLSLIRSRHFDNADALDALISEVEGDA